ncbi:MAG: selenocysteine-specific translation elongation factor [Acidimicrobiales bacterium]
MTVIATAGHVDHGKSTLVEALTGTDPDRWAEEKERGLTIDLGFALAVLPSGAELSLIDVPGHIRFLRNMLAGVGAVQGCIFVVSAIEGWKPQSEEHLRILDLLGIETGVVALTMADLVDDELVELAQLDIEEHVEGTFLEGAAVIPVSSITGRGIPELRAALDQLATTLGPAPDRGRPRLWVDRSFAPAGAGTVVTGTLVDGVVAIGDELEVSSTGRKARVRSLQRHHAKVDRTDPGTRLAVNLTGIAHHALGRGDVLIASNQWHHSAIIDAELRTLPTLAHEVSRRGAYSVYVGSGEFPVKLRILGDAQLTAGAAGLFGSISANEFCPYRATASSFASRGEMRQLAVAALSTSTRKPRQPKLNQRMTSTQLSSNEAGSTQVGSSASPANRRSQPSDRGSFPMQPSTPAANAFGPSWSRPGISVSISPNSASKTAPP